MKPALFQMSIARTTHVEPTKEKEQRKVPVIEIVPIEGK